MALIGWWPLDGNTEDYTVSKNNGVNNGVTWVNGKIGQAGSFNGTNSRITISSDNLLSLSENNNFSLWMNLNNNFSGRTFLNRRDQGNPGFYWFMIHNDKIFFQYYNGSNNVSLYTSKNITTAVSLNQWFHLSINLFNDKIDYYVNGILFESLSVSSIIKDQISSPFYIGSYQAWENNWQFSGLINDVRVYNHSLSQKEINDLAKAKILHYTFNKDEDVVYDSSGYKRNGNKINNPLWTSDSKIGSGAYEFNGIDSYISRQTIYTGNTFSVFAWVHPQSAINGRNVVIANGYPYSSNIGWLLCFQTNNQFFLSIGADIVWRQSVPELPINEWSFIGAVVNNSGTSIKLYINGVEVATTGSGSAPLSIDYSNATANIGRRNSEYFNGKMDELQVYQTALSDSDILDLYQTRAKIDNQGNLYVNEIVEDYEVKPGLTLNQLFESNKITAAPNTFELGTLTQTFDGVLTYTGNNTAYFLYTYNRSMIIGKKYYVLMRTSSSRAGNQGIWFRKSDNADSFTVSQSTNTDFKIDSGIVEPTTFNYTRYSKVYYNPRVVGDTYSLDTNEHYFITLTDVFGAGNEPTKEEMDSLYKDYTMSRPKSSGIMKTREFDEISSPSQETKIYENKIKIKGSLREG